VLIHNNLVHSRSPNKSSKDRLHVSVVYTLSCLRPTVDMTDQVMSRVVEAVKSVGDIRLLRLFGLDPYYRDKYNSGFVKHEADEWAGWLRVERGEQLVAAMQD